MEEDVYDLLVAIQADEVEIVEGLEAISPVFVEANHKLLHAHFPLLQLHYLAGVGLPELLLPVVVQPDRHDDEQRQAVVFDALLLHFRKDLCLGKPVLSNFGQFEQNLLQYVFLVELAVEVHIELNGDLPLLQDLGQ